MGSKQKLIIAYICLQTMLEKFKQYIMFWKKSKTDSPSSINLKLMHGINRISILMFIAAIIILIIRFIF